MLKDIDIFDLLFLAGLIMLAAGLYLAWPPLALIVPGSILTGRGLIGAGGD